MEYAEEVVGPSEMLVPVLNESLRLLFDYVDHVLGRVIAEEIQREREEVLGGALARRTETVRLILDGAALDAHAASGRLGYELARHHTAVIVWAESAATPAGALESVALTLAQAVGARRPLTVPAATNTLWVWIATNAIVPTSELRAAVTGADADFRVAVGPTQRGIGGFRRSHEAALSVHRLLAGNPDSGRLATYEELEVTALAAQDARRASEFVTSTLGPLADETPAAARLRETLRVFLEEAEDAAPYCRSAAHPSQHRPSACRPRHRTARLPAQRATPRTRARTRTETTPGTTADRHGAGRLIAAIKSSSGPHRVEA